MGSRSGTTVLAAALFPLLLASSGCGTGAFGAKVGPDAEALEGLRPTLWTQTSVERRGLCLQAFRAALPELEAALSDRSWTAAAEQVPMGEAAYAPLPPAVLIDVDETALDNSPYEARRILDGAIHTPDRFEAWAREARAEPVPGAVEFAKAVRARNVAVLFLTNRNRELEAATRSNLERAGFPLDSGDDSVISRGELDTTGLADKGERRRLLSQRYRIVLLVGDDLGDFLPDARAPLRERERMIAPYAEWWGRRWIVLPNPSYGSWEDSILGVDRVAGPEARRKRKLGALRTAAETIDGR